MLKKLGRPEAGVWHLPASREASGFLERIGQRREVLSTGQRLSRNPVQKSHVPGSFTANLG